MHDTSSLYAVNSATSARININASTAINSNTSTAVNREKGNQLP
jgi:hypothetical protein